MFVQYFEISSQNDWMPDQMPQQFFGLKYHDIVTIF